MDDEVTYFGPLVVPRALRLLALTRSMVLMSVSSLPHEPRVEDSYDAIARAGRNKRPWYFRKQQEIERGIGSSDRYLADAANGRG